MLTASDTSVLLSIAREAIKHIVTGQPYEASPREEKKLNERAGCFVTIKQKGQLRGCIGNFQSQQPLYREVVEMAEASATQDPRFEPMTAAELDDFDLEITVLSPLKKIGDTSEIIVGTHGIYIEKGIHRGVLLPQVASEYNWDRETFLRQTCLKAGLQEDTWTSADADIYIFSGQIISSKGTVE